jgi:hypothetical protein
MRGGGGVDLTSPPKTRTVAKIGNKGWSLYGALWLQSVAINGKSPEARRPKNKLKALP